MYNRQEIPLLLTVLIIEDILAIIALIFFSGLQQTNGTSMVGMVEHLIIGLSTLLIAYGIMLCTSKIMFNWLLKNGSDDMTRFLALGFCAGFSVLAYVLGLSPSAGAFLAGSIIASLPQAKSFEHVVLPYSETIGSLFFIAMGTMVNFGNIKPNLTFILVLFAAVILSRFIAVGLVSYVFAGFRGDQIFFASLAMISVGEFALLIAKLGSGFNLGIDIVTITSVIIFGTAVFMSLSVTYSKRVNNIWSSTKTPESLSNGFSNLAWYVRSFFDHVDTENSETTKFKN
ncbi:MAG: cation:proton antiporter, partial [Candidatus Woesearchaeota archaeon]